MKIFITGGSGFIGNRLVEKLISDKHDVTLLMRDQSKAMFTWNKQTKLIEGNLFDTHALRRGMKECDWVFHMAAYTKPWSKDPELAFKTNVTGTVNVLESALVNKVGKFVLTSTAGTMGFSRDGNLVDESSNPSPEYNTIYEKTKAEAEKIAVEYLKKGLHVIIVNPTRVYGPGRLTKSNSLTSIMKWYISGLWRIMPGDGKAIGNYVYIDDILEGLLLAAQFGRSGERYILGGENLSFSELFRIIGEEAGRSRKVFTLSSDFIKKIIKVNSLLTRSFGILPVITREWLEKYMNDWLMSSEKAVRELGYHITPFSEGAHKTISWIKSKQNGE